MIICNMMKFKNEQIVINGVKVDFYNLPTLYKGKEEKACILKSENQKAEDLLNVFFSEGFCAVIYFEQTSAKDKLSFEKAAVMLNNFKTFYSAFNYSELNLYQSLCQFDYKLIKLFNDRPDYFELNMDNNFIWGTKNQKNLSVFGMIINRPKTFKELLDCIKTKGISKLTFYWNKENKYKKLFKSYKVLNNTTYYAHYNTNIIPHNCQLNLMFPFIELYE